MDGDREAWRGEIGRRLIVLALMSHLFSVFIGPRLFGTTPPSTVFVAPAFDRFATLCPPCLFGLLIAGLFNRAMKVIAGAGCIVFYSLLAATTTNVLVQWVYIGTFDLLAICMITLAFQPEKRHDR